LITLHCLKYSRAIRLVWLMEDLRQPYELVMYDRTEDFHAPQSLSKVHPLGKSPVMEDADVVLAESATSLRYLTDKFDDDTHRPEKGTRGHLRHEELLDYVESSFAPAAMGLLLPKLKGEEPSQEAHAAMQKHLDYVAQQLTQDGLLFGKTATLADIQFSYLLANLSGMGFLNDAPRIASYWADLQQQSGYKAAIAKAGPMAPPS
jgi:glutathione S-transferase